MTGDEKSRIQGRAAQQAKTKICHEALTQSDESAYKYAHEVACTV